jgi:hypothetical protein
MTMTRLNAIAKRHQETKVGLSLRSFSGIFWSIKATDFRIAQAAGPFF